MDMKGRLWALAQVGKFVGFDAMVNCIKDEEVEDLRQYVNRFYYNANGLPQEMEMEIASYQFEAAEHGWALINFLRDWLYQKTFCK